MIWHGVFLKLGVYFDGLVSRKQIFLESSHSIETRIDVVVEIIEFQIIVSLWFYFYDNPTEFLLADLMFESPNATNFHKMFTFIWWSLLVRR